MPKWVKGSSKKNHEGITLPSSPQSDGSRPTIPLNNGSPPFTAKA